MSVPVDIASVPDDESLSWRHKLLWEIHDFSSGRGLEVGPLDNATVPKHLAKVQYVDVFGRDRLMQHYESEPSRVVERIPEIDFTLARDDGSIQTLAEAAAPGAPYDWVMASHVIEHVPDLIGWLDQIAELVVDGGKLVLAVPDRRYCFDVHRPQTTVGQLLQAHDLGETAPSVRAVYDYFRAHAVVKTHEIWSGNPPGYDARRYSLEHTLAQVARARAGEYVDAHVWTFTPQTLLEQVVELRTLGLSSWMVHSMTTTKRNHLEFYVVLERLPRDGLEARLAAEPAVDSSMPDHVADPVALRRELVQARAQLRVARRRLKAARGLIERKNERITGLQAKVARLRSHSEGPSPVQPRPNLLARVLRRLR